MKLSTSKIIGNLGFWKGYLEKYSVAIHDYQIQEFNVEPCCTHGTCTSNLELGIQGFLA